MTIKSMDKLSSSLNVIISFLTKGIIFLMPLFFLPWTVEYFEYNKQFLLWMMSLILLIIWLVKIIVAEKISYKKTLLDVPIGVFLLFGTIAAVLSIDTFSSWFGYYGNFSDAWIGTICLALFYFILIHFINNQKKIISYLKIFIYSSGVAILVALLSMCGLFADWMAWSFNTISGSFNNLVVFNAAVSVLILGVLCFCSDTFKKYEKFIFQLILSGALIGMCLFSLWQAWVVLLVGALILLALIFLTDKKWFTIKRNFLAGGLILLAVSFIYFSDINLDNFFLGRNLPQEITLPLAESAKISSSAFLDQPLFGSGPGTFAYDFSLYRPADFNSADVWQLRFDKSGSYFLEMLATKGALASLSLFVLIGIFLFFCAIAFWKSKKEKINLFVALFPGFFAVLVIYAICPTFTVTRFLFWFLLALIMTFWLDFFPALSSRRNFNLSGKSKTDIGVKIILFFLAAGVILLLGYTIRFWVADIFYKANGDKNIAKAIQLNPHRYNYYIGQAKYYLNKINTEISLADYHRINYNNLQNYLDRSINSAIFATSINPQSVISWETAGMIYRDTSESTIGGNIWAINSFARALELEPTNPVLATELGKAYAENGQNEKATEYFIRALDLKYDYYEAGFALAKTYIKQGREAEAETLLADIALKTGNAEIYYELGRFYYNQGEIYQAITQFEKVLAVMPKHSNAIFSLGIAYDNLGDEKQALGYYKKVLELNPGNMEIIGRIEKLENK